MRDGTMRSMNGLLNRVRHYCERHQLLNHGKMLVLAVSGGVDSLAMLHILHTLAPEFEMRLHVATLDHGLRGAESAADTAFVREQAAALDLPVTAGFADVAAYAQQHKLGIEAAARRVRYRFLADVAEQVGAPAVATAHQQEDQAETLLLHLIRGAGLTGLRGMQPRTALPDGIALVRPLLDTSRADLEAFLNEHGLTAREDASNADTRYTRNRVRHDVLPLLRAINPAVVANLAHTAQTLTVDYGALHAMVAGSDRREAFAVLPLSVQRLAILGNHVNRDDLTRFDVDRAVEFILNGKTGESIKLSNGLQISLSFNHILFDEEPDWNAPGLEPGSVIPIDQLPTIVDFMDDWEVRLSRGISADGEYYALLKVPADVRLAFRTRRRGERFTPHGMDGYTQSLSDTFTNMKVPAAWRDHVPLLTIDDQIAAFIAPTTKGLTIRLAHPYGTASVTDTEILLMIFRRRKLPIAIDPSFMYT